MEQNFNSIYLKLVADENDLIGLIAYGLYKKHKIEFIESYKADRGCLPSKDDCSSFATSSSTPLQLQQYRDSAEALLQKMTLEAAKVEISEFENTLLRNYKAEIREAVRDEQPKWWHSVLFSVLGAFIFSALIAFAFYLGSTTEKNSVDLMQSAVETVSHVITPTSSADTLLIK